MSASISGQLDVVRFLVERRANVDFIAPKHDFMDSAVRYAVQNEHWDVVEYLIPHVRNQTDKRFAKRNLDKALGKVSLTPKKPRKKVIIFPRRVDFDQLIETELGVKYIDYVIGEGESIQEGDIAIFNAQVQPLGFDYCDNGGTFESYKVVRKAIGNKVSYWMLESWKNKSVNIGKGSVNLAFEKGVLGMLVGGMRRVLIPPELSPKWSDFDPMAEGDTVVYDVKLLAIKKNF